MKIVNKKTFLALPENTIFSKYDPHCFGDLCIKDETWSNDFIFLSFRDAIEAESSSELFDILEEKFKITLEGLELSNFDIKIKDVIDFISKKINQNTI